MLQVSVETRRRLSAQTVSNTDMDIEWYRVDALLQAELEYYGREHLLAIGVGMIDSQYLREAVRIVFTHTPRVERVALVEASFDVDSSSHPAKVLHLRDLDSTRDRVTLEAYPHFRVTAQLRLQLSPCSALAHSHADIDRGVMAANKRFPPQEAPSLQSQEYNARRVDRIAHVCEALRQIPHATFEERLLVCIHIAMQMKGQASQRVISRLSVYDLLNRADPSSLYPAFDVALNTLKERGLVSMLFNKKSSVPRLFLTASGADRAAELLA